MFEKAIVIVNPHKDYEGCYKLIENCLSKRGISIKMIEVPLFSDSRENIYLNDHAGVGLVISLGGDGTLLFTARFLLGLDIPVMGVNLGTFGFLTEIKKTEIEQALRDFFADNYEIEKRSLLITTINRDGAEIGRFPALNEVVIGRKEITRLITLETYVNGNFFCSYRADGLLVSTATGSTAYSLSANGPIMMPTLNNIIINPICPHTIASRPFIISGDDEVSVKISGHDISPYISFDVQLGTEIEEGDAVIIKRYPKPLKLVVSKNRSFFQVLRDKLGWTNI